MSASSIRVLVAAGAFLLAAGSADAQAPVRVALDPGTDVRLTTHDAPYTRIRGRVESMGPDTVRLTQPGGFRAAYATSQIQVLEIRGGEDKKRGFLIGAGIGAGIVVVFGGIDHARGEISGSELFGTVVGNALLGGLIGYVFAPKGWERIPVPR